MTPEEHKTARFNATKNAIRSTVGEFTYMGIHVGSYVTDEEVERVAINVLNALIDVDKLATA